MVANGQNSGGLPEREDGNDLVDATGASGYLSAEDLIIPFVLVVFFSFLLAAPVLAYTIAVDIDHGGRWVCDPRPVGEFGVVHDRNGAPVCQFEFHTALLAWILYAAIVSPVPIFVVYLRHVLKQLKRLGAAGDSAEKNRLTRAFFIDIGLCVLFAAAVGRGWPLSFMILPGAALVVYVCRLLQALRQEDANW